MLVGMSSPQTCNFLDTLNRPQAGVQIMLYFAGLKLQPSRANESLSAAVQEYFHVKVRTPMCESIEITNLLIPPVPANLLLPHLKEEGDLRKSGECETLTIARIKNKNGACDFHNHRTDCMVPRRKILPWDKIKLAESTRPPGKTNSRAPLQPPSTFVSQDPFRVVSTLWRHI